MYQIEQLSESNFNKLIPLMKDAFGMEVDINYFKWKFLNNPSGNAIGFFAVHQETKEVAAYYGVIPEKYCIGGIEKTIYQSCDTMTHSMHRRKGLFKLLANHLFDYLKDKDAFIIGFGGGQSTPGFIKFGWKHIFSFKYYFYPTKFNWKEQKGLNLIKHISIEELEKIIQRTKTNQSIYSTRTLEILKWRLSHPQRDYKIIKNDSKNSNSYLIYYIKFNKIFILDHNLESKKDSEKLLRFLKQECNKLNLKGIVAFISAHHRDIKQLRKNYFISNPFKFGPLNERVPFIIFNLNNQYPLLQYNKWHLTAFDHDAF